MPSQSPLWSPSPGGAAAYEAAGPGALGGGPPSARDHNPHAAPRSGRGQVREAGQGLLGGAWAGRDVDSGAGPGRAGEGRGKDSGAGPGRSGTCPPGRGRDTNDCGRSALCLPAGHPEVGEFRLDP